MNVNMMKYQTRDTKDMML